MRALCVDWTGDVASIEVTDLTLVECRALRVFLAAADLGDSGAVLRLCLEPPEGDAVGWVIVEFLSGNQGAIRRVAHEMDLALRRAREGAARVARLKEVRSVLHAWKHLSERERAEDFRRRAHEQLTGWAT